MDADEDEGLSGSDREAVDVFESERSVHAGEKCLSHDGEDAGRRLDDSRSSGSSKPSQKWQCNQCDDWNDAQDQLCDSCSAARSGERSLADIDTELQGHERGMQEYDEEVDEEDFQDLFPNLASQEAASDQSGYESSDRDQQQTWGNESVSDTDDGVSGLSGRHSRSLRLEVVDGGGSSSSSSSTTTAPRRSRLDQIDDEDEPHDDGAVQHPMFAARTHVICSSRSRGDTQDVIEDVESDDEGPHFEYFETVVALERSNRAVLDYRGQFAGGMNWCALLVSCATLISTCVATAAFRLLPAISPLLLVNLPNTQN